MQLGEKKLFECKTHHGFFLKRSQIAENLGTTRFGYKLATPKAFSKPLSVGQFVTTTFYGVGQIHYMGRSPFAGSHADDEDDSTTSSSYDLIGIELKVWSPNCGNGIVHDKRLMDVGAGYSYFCTNYEISSVVESPDEDGLVHGWTFSKISFSCSTQRI